MQKIIVISYKKLSKIVYKKLFLSLLEKKKIYFIYFENITGELFNQKVIQKKNIKHISLKNIENLKKTIKNINPDFIICNFIENITLKFTEIYNYISSLSIPKIKILEPNFLSKYNLIKYFCLNLFAKKYFYYDFGVFESIATKFYFYRYKFKNKIFFHNNNYLDFLNVEKKNISKKYCLFLDENLALHPDLNAKKNYFSLSHKKYYSEINFFLNFLKKKYKINVIVSAHPTTNKNFFKNFKLIKYRTAALVKNAKFVIVHQSSSIDFPILFKKKILFITSNDINKTYLGTAIKKISNFFKKKPINISSKINPENLNINFVNYDEKKYKLYKDYFIRHPMKKVNNFYNFIFKHLKKMT